MSKRWDNAIKDRVCTLWKEGLSFKETAAAMTNSGIPMTHQMVNGIIHRSKDIGPRKSIPIHSNGGYGPGKSKPKPPPPPTLIMEVPEGGMFVTMEALTSRTCRYPIGDVGDSGFCFCGKPPKLGKPYCEDHARICFQPMTHGARMSAEDRKAIADMNRLSGSQRAFG